MKDRRAATKGRQEAKRRAIRKELRARTKESKAHPPWRHALHQLTR